MLKSEVFRNKKLVKDRRRSKKIKKQINFRKTHKSKVAFQDLSKDSDKRIKKQKRKRKRKEIKDEYRKSD